MQKPFYQRWLFIFLILVLVIGIIENIVDSGEKAKTTEVEAATSPFYKKMAREELKEKMAENHLSPEVIAAKIIMENFGSTAIEKERALVSSKFESGVVEGIALEENVFSAESLKQSSLQSTVDFMKAMKAEEDVTQATLIVQAPLADPYGNVEIGDVMIIIMSRETLNKINFNKFQPKHLSFVADSYWEHPVLSKE